MPIFTRVCEADPDIIHHGWGVRFWMWLARTGENRANSILDKAFDEVQWMRDAEGFTDVNSLANMDSLVEMGVFMESARTRTNWVEEEDEE